MEASKTEPGSGGVDYKKEIAKARVRGVQLMEQLKTARSLQSDAALKEWSKDPNNHVKPLPELVDFRCRRTLQGHSERIYVATWAKSDSHATFDGKGAMRRIVSGGKGGQLFVWNAVAGVSHNAGCSISCCSASLAKKNSSLIIRQIKLRSPWVMTTEFTPDGTRVISAGVDNLVSIYGASEEADLVDYGYAKNFDDELETPIPQQNFKNTNGESATTPVGELRGHRAFISSSSFMSSIGTQMTILVTGSGDGTAKMWDLNEATLPRPYNTLNATDRSILTCKGHIGPVLTVASMPTSSDIFLSGGMDGTVRLWDSRANPGSPPFLRRILRTGPDANTAQSSDRSRRFSESSMNSSSVEGSDAISKNADVDVNIVRWLPDGNCFLTASDDSIVRLYDLRSDGEIGRYDPTFQELPGHTIPLSSLTASSSGRLAIAGYDDGNVIMWDVLTMEKHHMIGAHDGRVSALDVSPDGNALMSASWDGDIKIWA